MIKSINKLIIISFGILTLVLLNSIYQINFHNIQNADALLYASFFNDLFFQHYPLTDWKILTIPNFIPFFYFFTPFFALFQNNAAAFFFVNIIELALIILLLLLLAKIVYSKNLSLLSIPILFIFSLFLLLDLKNGALFYDLTTPYHHLFNTIFCLLTLVFFLKYFETKRTDKTILLFLLCFFSSLNDQIFITSLSLPLFFVGLFLKKTKKATISKSFLLSLLLGSVTGLLFLAITKNSIPISFTISNFLISISSLRDYESDSNLVFAVLWLVSYLFNVTATIKLYRSKNSKTSLLAFYLFIVILPFCILPPIFISGRYSGITTSRYLTFLEILPVVNLVIVFFMWTNTKLTNGFYLFFQSFCFILLLIIGLGSEKNLISLSLSWLTHNPHPSKCIDFYASRKKLPTAYGLTDYWHARLLTFSNQNHLQLNQINNDGTALLRLSNNYDYFLKDKGRYQLVPYSFIVVNSELDQETIINNLGKPDTILNCSPFNSGTKEKILVYKTVRNRNLLTKNFFDKNKNLFLGIETRKPS